MAFTSTELQEFIVYWGRYVLVGGGGAYAQDPSAKSGELLAVDGFISELQARSSSLYEDIVAVNRLLTWTVRLCAAAATRGEGVAALSTGVFGETSRMSQEDVEDMGEQVEREIESLRSLYTSRVNAFYEEEIRHLSLSASEYAQRAERQAPAIFLDDTYLDLATEAVLFTARSYPDQYVLPPRSPYGAYLHQWNLLAVEWYGFYNQYIRDILHRLLSPRLIIPRRTLPGRTPAPHSSLAPRSVSAISSTLVSIPAMARKNCIVNRSRGMQRRMSVKFHDAQQAALRSEYIIRG